MYSFVRIEQTIQNLKTHYVHTYEMKFYQSNGRKHPSKLADDSIYIATETFTTFNQNPSKDLKVKRCKSHTARCTQKYASQIQGMCWLASLIDVCNYGVESFSGS
jgi:hypothetical protein